MIFSDFSVLERENKIKSGAITSTLMLIFLLCLIFIKSKFEPEELKDMGGGGVVIARGWPDQGMYEDTPSPGPPAPAPETAPPVPTPPTPAPPTPSAPSNTNVVTSDAETDYTVKKQKEEKARKDREDSENKTRREEENAAREKQRAQEEAVKKAAAERAAEEAKYKAAKDKAKGNFGGGGTGRGSGNGNTGGNGGDPNGSPDASKLGGTPGNGGGNGGGSGTGSGGAVGGGLSGRTGKSPGAIIDNSQATGIIRINICADASGNVVSAEFTQVGSTTSNSELKSKAIAHAKRYKFSAGKDGDCGWVTYNFKAQ